MKATLTQKHHSIIPSISNDVGRRVVFFDFLLFNCVCDVTLLHSTFAFCSPKSSAASLKKIRKLNQWEKIKQPFSLFQLRLHMLHLMLSITCNTADALPLPSWKSPLGGIACCVCAEGTLKPFLKDVFEGNKATSVFRSYC